MGMNVGPGAGSGEPDVMIDINTTPLIDVMLVLLVMLIITIPIQLHRRLTCRPAIRDAAGEARCRQDRVDAGAWVWNGESCPTATLEKAARGGAGGAARAGLRPTGPPSTKRAGVMASSQGSGSPRSASSAASSSSSTRPPGSASALRPRSQPLCIRTAREPTRHLIGSVRHSGARAGLTPVTDCPQGGRGDQEALPATIIEEGQLRPPPPPAAPPDKIVEAPKVLAQVEPTSRRRRSCGGAATRRSLGGHPGRRRPSSSHRPPPFSSGRRHRRRRRRTRGAARHRPYRAPGSRVSREAIRACVAKGPGRRPPPDDERAMSPTYVSARRAPRVFDSVRDALEMEAWRTREVRGRDRGQFHAEGPN